MKNVRRPHLQKVNTPPGPYVVLALALVLGVSSLVFRVMPRKGQEGLVEMVPVEEETKIALEDEDVERTVPGEEPEEEPVEVDPYADKPDIDVSSWEFILANPTHSIEEYEPDLDAIEDIYLDYRIIEPMEEFVSDTRAQGLSVFLSSGYRSYDEQSWLFEMQVEYEDGDEEEAATIVARPGTSEHQTGLAADITDDYYEIKNDELEKTETYQWMSAHCQDYGFIVRFPKGKEDVTGIIYEPWHFRYVGKTAAKYIMEKGLTLEEFLALYE